MFKHKSFFCACDEKIALSCEYLRVMLTSNVDWQRKSRILLSPLLKASENYFLVWLPYFIGCKIVVSHDWSVGLYILFGVKYLVPYFTRMLFVVLKSRDDIVYFGY